MIRSPLVQPLPSDFVAVCMAALLLAVPALPASASPPPARIAAEAPETPEEQLAAASALFDSRKYAEASRKLEAFLAANPRHSRASAAALALGRCRGELGQFAQAVAAYEMAAASSDPAIQAPARLGLGEAYLQTRQFEKAASALEPALRLDMSRDQAAVGWYWLGQAQFALGRFAQAEESYGRVAQDFRRAEVAQDARFGSAVAALRQGKTELARQRLAAIVQRYPDAEVGPKALLALGRMDLEAKRFHQARAELEDALRRMGERQRATEDGRVAEEGLVQALLEMQDYRAAAARLEQSLLSMHTTEPRRARAQLTLGHCRTRLKENDRAVAAYVEAAKSTEEAVVAEALYWGANALLALNRPAEAASQFARVAEKYPSHVLASKAQLRAGQALRSAKQDLAASAAFRAVLDRFPKSPQAAEAKSALGEIVDSASDPAQLAAALKATPPAERARGTVRLARLYIDQKRETESAAQLQALVKSTPAPEPEVLAEAEYLLGCLDAASRPASAIDSLSSALRRSDTAPWAMDARRRLAWLLLGAKRPAEAESAAQAVLDSTPAAEVEQDARLALLQALLDQQKWDAALAAARAVHGGGPEVQAVSLYTQAWIADKQGRAEEAAPLWERLAAEFKATPQGQHALIRIGDARLKAGKFDEARDRYAALLAAQPAPPPSLVAEAHYKLGTALYNLDKFAESAAEFDIAAGSRSSGEFAPESLYWAGAALDKAGRKDDAIVRLSRLVAQFPSHARVAAAKIRLAALKAR